MFLFCFTTLSYNSSMSTKPQLIRLYTLAKSSTDTCLPGTSVFSARGWLADAHLLARFSSYFSRPRALGHTYRAMTRLISIAFLQFRGWIHYDAREGQSRGTRPSTLWYSHSLIYTPRRGPSARSIPHTLGTHDNRACILLCELPIYVQRLAKTKKLTPYKVQVMFPDADRPLGFGHKRSLIIG